MGNFRVYRVTPIKMVGYVSSMALLIGVIAYAHVTFIEMYIKT